MSTLHTVNKSPFETGSFLSCLKHCKPGDAVLLLEDGVYGAIDGTPVATEAKAGLDNVTLYALQDDLTARGIAPEKLMGEVKAVGYDGFVDLVAENDRTQAWL